MKILSMTATFGKLDHQTLELKEGLNVLSAPNEWGKSTWCAFLVAMLYGIDTRERTTKDSLSVKERFQPWSGRPMEGTIRLIHQGRDITIQRRTRGRVPMGEFSAWETDTGLTIRELTGENCGQTLLGVEKSVFLRTGFLRFSDLPVTADDSLRRRLNALVTTGDESGSAQLLGTKLKELKNRCRHNHTGLIPECQGQIQQIQQQLWDVQSLQQQHDALSSQEEALQQRLEELENHRIHLDWQESQADQQRLKDARAAVRTATLFERALLEKYTDNPDRANVEAKIRQGKELLDEVELALEEPPGAMRGVALTALLAGILLICALLMADQGMLLPCLVLSLVLLGICLGILGRRRRRRIWYNIEQTRRKGKRDELQKYIESWKSQLRVLDELDRARENVRQTRSLLEALESMARNAAEPEAGDSLTLSREETMRTIGEVTQQLSLARTQLAQLQGRMETFPEEDVLQRRLSQARHRLTELEKTNTAIGYALAALESAMQELQRRFAPRITRRAGEYLSRLTGGAYDRISINEDLSVLSARDDEATLRSPLWRSEGTGDQMYLALRLAVWEVLAPECPLILDDALIRFDQTRLERAMELLAEMGRHRQLLLFTCQDRERNWLDRQNLQS